MSLASCRYRKTKTLAGYIQRCSFYIIDLTLTAIVLVDKIIECKYIHTYIPAFSRWDRQRLPIVYTAHVPIYNVAKLPFYVSANQVATI